MEKNESRTLEGEALITVHRTKSTKVLDEFSEGETILVRKFETAPAYVCNKVGVTKNMGNFESVRIDVGVKIPCYTEEINEVEKQAAMWVDRKMDAKLSEIEGSGKVV